MLLGIVTIPAIVNVGIAYVTRNQTRRPHRDHHVPRIRRGLECAAGVRRHHRARHPVPRPATTRAAVALRPPVDGRRLRRWRRSGALLDLVRVLVPAPGGAVRRQDARERQRARLPLDHADVLWKVPVAVGVARRCSTRCSVPPSRRSPSRRIVAGASFIGLFLVSSITAGVLTGDFEEKATGSAAALINVLGTAPVPARPRVPRPDRPGIAAQGGRNGGLYAVVAYAVVLGGRGTRAAAPLSLDGAVTLGPPILPRSRVRRRRHGRGRPTHLCGSARRSRCPS